MLVSIVRKFGFGRVVEIASGDTLKEACLNWDSDRRCSDDLNNAFESSEFYKLVNFDEDGEIVDDSYNEAYNKFIDSLSGREMYWIMEDGNYTDLRFDEDEVIEVWIKYAFENDLERLTTLVNEYNAQRRENWDEEEAILDVKELQRNDAFIKYVISDINHDEMVEDLENWNYDFYG